MHVQMFRIVDEDGEYFALECKFVPGVSEKREVKCADCGGKYKNYWALNWKEDIKRRICPECFTKLCGFAPVIVSARRFISIIEEMHFNTEEEADKVLSDIVGGSYREEKESKGGEKRKMNNLLKALDEMVTVYDSFCEEIGMKIPLAILDTESWKAIKGGYKHDATLTLKGGKLSIMLDIERALENGSPAFVLAHEYGHIEQLEEGRMSMKPSERFEKDADERAVRILEEAGFVVKRSVGKERMLPGVKENI